MMDFISISAAYLLGFYFSTFSPNHTPATSCDKHDGVEFCFYKGDEASKRVVYFLHGFGNDTNAWSWNSVTKRIEENWKIRNTRKPHVVTISFGRLWWYTNIEQGHKLKAFTVWIEKEKKLDPSERILYGDSMGAHNSYRWARDMPELFKRVALICPAVPSSFTKEEKSPGLWPFYAVADSVIRKSYSEAKPAILNPLEDVPYWESFNKVPYMHVIVSSSDHFGFYPGGKELIRRLEKNLITKLTSEEQDVTHCDVDAQKLAPFLGE
jgi:pimeloyl-ACP methyl ester carboxylesterase